MEATDFNILNMDVQGAEMGVLKGAGNVLARLDVIYMEVSFAPLYDGCSLTNEIDSFLDPHDFVRAWTKLAPDTDPWGDALYVRKAYANNMTDVTLT